MQCSNGCLGGVQSAISQRQGRVQRDLGDVGQQGGGHLLVYVCRRGLQVDRGRQVSGAGSVQKRRGNLLVHIRPRLLGGKVQSQLVSDRSKGVVGCHASQGRIVGAGDRAVHGCRCGVARQLRVDACRGGLAIHLQLQGVQGRLVRFAGQPSGEARVQSRNAAGVRAPNYPGPPGTKHCPIFEPFLTPP